LKNSEKVILGIDPGTNVLGYGIVESCGQKPKMVVLGIIELDKFDDHYIKLQKIFERVLSLVDEYKPDEMALEAPFFGKNVQSMLKLGRAQGVAMAAGLYRQVPIFEYSPRKIKQAITGNGNASKEQVAALLKGILELKEMPPQLDATDGLAAAVCHFYQNRVMIGKGAAKNWKDFIRQNPEKVK